MLIGIRVDGTQPKRSHIFCGQCISLEPPLFFREFFSFVSLTHPGQLEGVHSHQHKILSCLRVRLMAEWFRGSPSQKSSHTINGHLQMSCQQPM